MPAADAVPTNDWNYFGAYAMSNIIEQLETEQLSADIPEFAPGDTIVVQVRVTEGQRERLQAFEGVVIAKRSRGLNSSFTVRKVWRRR